MDDITYRNLKLSTKLPFSLINVELNAGSKDSEQFEILSQIKENIVDFVKNGKCLYIGSHNSGNGKTSWATILGKEYFDKSIINASLRVRGGEVVKPVFYINVPDYLALRKNAIGNYDMQMKLREYEYNIATAKLVIFDDISDVQASDYDNNYLYSWINTRIENGYSCIFTSNAETEEELLEIYQPKLIDRIFNNSIVVTMRSGSRRWKNSTY